METKQIVSKKTYKVVKYFDTYPDDGAVMTTEDLEKAKLECVKMNEKVKHLPHTEYLVRSCM